MSSQEAFQRTKQHNNIITIGHTGHGKTTLTAALSKVTAKRFGGQENSFEQITTSHTVEYDTPVRHYTHVDYPSNADDLNNVLAGDVKFNGAILVVSVTEGLTSQTSEQVEMAKQAGIPYIATFLNKCDISDDDEALVLVEMEVREMLSNNDYPGDNVFMIRGSALKALEGEAAWQAKIIDLTEVFDACFPKI
ncbi:MAG: GTP-binding protein [Microcoleus sp.]